MSLSQGFRPNAVDEYRLADVQLRATQDQIKLVTQVNGVVPDSHRANGDDIVFCRVEAGRFQIKYDQPAV